MSVMIADVRRLNGERLSAFKESMKEFVKAKRKYLDQCSDNLTAIEQVNIVQNRVVQRVFGSVTEIHYGGSVLYAVLLV